MAASSLQARVNEARETIGNLKQRIETARSQKSNGGLSDVSHTLSPLYNDIALRRTLRGHFGKVYAIHWSPDGRIVSASQDGKLLIWNAFTTNKLQAIPLRSSWVMTCAFEPTQMQVVASGGLDNVCSIYQIDQQQVTRASKELAGHEGYLSCCRFMDTTTVVTSSGDSTCVVWDIERATPKLRLLDHGGDVMSIALHPELPDLLVSGSCDTTARCWDMRSGDNTHTFIGHASDVNSVSLMSNGQTIVTGSDDSTSRLFDMRCYSEVQCLGAQNITCGITSVSFSASGRLVFSGSEDHNCFVWDTCSSAQEPHAVLRDKNGTAHENRVSCVAVNASGDAVCTGSWDSTAKCWA